MSEIPPLAVGHQCPSTRNSDEAFALTLRTLLADGHGVETRRASDSKPKKSREILNFQIAVSEPRDRILINPERSLNVVGAVARFVWMLAGSDRLEDIAYYEPKVRHYTDDKISVPGSCYGRRLFQSSPGLNQLDGVVENLQSEEGSRRAATVIWSAADAIRGNSKDIPCAFGAFYHIRGGQLIATTMMRSNNAFILLPYNLFEFGLLAEMVASKVGVDLGQLVHFAVSMHLFAEFDEAAAKAVRGYEDIKGGPRTLMQPMPRSHDPFEQGRELVRLEAALRHDHNALRNGDLKVLSRRAEDRLSPYWLDFYNVLLAHSLATAGHRDEAAQVARSLPTYFQASVLPAVKPEDKPSGGRQGTLFDTGVTVSDEIQQVFAPTPSEVHECLDLLTAHCAEIETSTGELITRIEADELRKRLVMGHPLAIAARSEEEGGAATDRFLLTERAVREELDRIRRGTPGA